jgi:hypothetical protein
MQLLKRILDILPDDELLQVSNLASKAKKRRKRKLADQSKTGESVSVPEEHSPSVSAPEEPVAINNGFHEDNLVGFYFSMIMLCMQRLSSVKKNRSPN